MIALKSRPLKCLKNMGVVHAPLKVIRYLKEFARRRRLLHDKHRQ